MNKVLKLPLIFFFSISLSSHLIKGSMDIWKVSSPTAPKTQETAAKDLIARILPKRAQEFDVVVNTDLLNPDLKDKFILESIENNTRIRITGTSGVSVANGFNYYLKRYLNCHISWSGDQLYVPDTPLPVINTTLTIIIQDKLRYYQNVCTVSYSMVWWDFKRWQREIDWMALKGINFPLAFNGQELIWRKVFQKFGLTAAEVDEYFTGPAFLAWNRMGNFQGWSGPLTENWHNYQAVLQTQILERMRSLGMLPVLPAFAGHVPRNITRVLPKAKVSRLSNWSNFNDTFCCTSFLEPEDPYFVQIGSTFIDEYKSVYGTDHFYNTDLFNEMIPKSRSTQYLSDCGHAVYQSLINSDPQSIWVMQGWLFHNDPGFWHKEETKALVTSVPQGKLLILDLDSELYPQFSQFEGYYGQPFIWCMLHNFGGALGMYGAFNHINGDVFADRKKYDNMVGVGLTPEGIEQNDIIYDFFSESIWYTQAVDLDKWVDQYLYRRYNYINDDLIKAWRLLQNSVYTDPIKVANHGRYRIVERPKLTGQSVLWYKPNDVFNAFHIIVNTSSSTQLQNSLTFKPSLTARSNLWYKPSEPIKAFQLIVNTSSSSQLKNSITFKYDLVDITRQYLQLGFDIIHDKVVDAFKQKNQTDFSLYSKLLLSIHDDMNDILSTNENFLLGKWIESARALAKSDQEKLFNEYNARNQITIWGPNGNILDYANKQWSGLFAGYYKPRWQLFIDALQKSLTDKTAFNQTQFNSDVFNKVELYFVNQHNSYPIVPTGDPFIISSNIYSKYKDYFKTNDTNIKYYSGE